MFLYFMHKVYRVREIYFFMIINKIQVFRCSVIFVNVGFDSMEKLYRSYIEKNREKVLLKKVEK